MVAKLECILCPELFSEYDILNNRFFPETRVCYNCYLKLQKSSYDISCFGKKTKNSNLGFDQMAVECREYCPDRKLCPKFIKDKFIQVTKIEAKPKEVVTTRLYPFRSHSIIDRAFRLCQQGVTKSKLKSWCAKQGTNYYRVIKVLKGGKKYGKSWRFHEDGVRIDVEYPIDRTGAPQRL